MIRRCCNPTSAISAQVPNASVSALISALRTTFRLLKNPTATVTPSRYMASILLRRLMIAVAARQA